VLLAVLESPMPRYNIPSACADTVVHSAIVIDKVKFLIFFQSKFS